VVYRVLSFNFRVSRKKGNLMVSERPVVMHQARWVIPMAGPVIADGAVAVAGDRIVAVGPAAAIRQDWRDNDLEADGFVFHDHGNGAIIPALVNTHLHLEFTALRGAVPPQADLPAWLQAAIEAFIILTPQEIDRGVREGLAELRRFGTILGAEVSNTGRSLPLLTASGLDFHYFYECLGFDLFSETPLTDDFPFLAREEIASLPVSAAAHAPYSVSGPLFRRIKTWNRERGRLTSVHLAESRQESHFLQEGQGPLQELLARRGRWYDNFAPPGCSPAVYLDRLGFWSEETLAVHGVWLADADRKLLARRGVWLSLCPRSNRHTGAGFPDLAALRNAGVRVTLGTDSLASCDDLNLFKEIKVLHESFPEVQISALLAMATKNGAVALQRDHDLGSLEPGKKAAMLFLDIPLGVPLWPGLLAAGVEGRISWLTSHGKESWNGA
jgi:cytosine/adenosine deaminase-related metal-dependent hydrolase